MFKPIIFSALLFLSPVASAADYAFNKTTGTVTAADCNYKLGAGTFLLAPDAPDSPYAFKDALKAIEAVNNAKESNVTLLVAPGVYWLDDPDDPAIRRNPKNSGSIPYAAEIRCDNLSILGLAENPEDVVFAVNRGQTQGALGNFTMFHFFGKSLRTENITFGNYCNLDLVYPRDPKLNRPKRREAIVQAQLGICEGTDRLFARNCRFLSRLNLCPFVGAHRSLFKDCYFECTDDALAGSAVYLDCRFTFFSGKPFYSTASTGAVFLNCDIHSLVNGTQYLTKAPGMVSMIDTRFTSDNPVTLQWTRDASPIRCYQSNVTLNGTPVTIDANRPELSADLTSSPLLKAYKVTVDGKTIYNTPNLFGGNDGWDPLGVLPEIHKAEEAMSTSLTSLPVALRLLSSGKELEAQGDTINLTPSLRLWGDYDVPNPILSIKWAGPTTLKLQSVAGRATATSANKFPRAVESIVTASTANGLVGATAVKISPFLKDAPGFASTPGIVLDKTSLKAGYTLTGDGTDDSYIVWYRSSRPDLADSVAVRHGHGLSAASYPLTSADHGCFISATITPKHSDSRAGEGKTVAFNSEILPKMSKSNPNKERTLYTSFAEIPIRKGKPGRPGFWHFDSYKPADTNLHDWTPDENLSWYYGRGVDAATGLGLVQATRGARLSYTPMRPGCKGMHLSLVAEPSKGPGQGFGSATGQYMDICISFNAATRTGYGLRIERTPDYDKAVTFRLIRYIDGEVTPVSEPVATNCFRNPCHISVEISNGQLTASARSEAPAATSADPAVKSEVFLTAKVSPLYFPSFAIQHTGSVGASATLIRDLNVKWD